MIRLKMPVESLAIGPQLGKPDQPRIEGVLGDIIGDASIELAGCANQFAQTREQLA